MTDSRLVPTKPGTPYVPPGKGPVEPERVEGNPMPLCKACKRPIAGRYRTHGADKYHYDDMDVACLTAWRVAHEMAIPQEIAIAAAMHTTSALGVPGAEIRENVLPSNEKALSKVEPWVNTVSEPKDALTKCVDHWLPGGPEYSEIRAGLLRDLRTILRLGL